MCVILLEFLSLLSSILPSAPFALAERVVPSDHSDAAKYFSLYLG